MDTTNAYRDARVRITELLRTAGPDIAGQTVPACPEWTVKDVAAHVAGVTTDILAGNLEGVGTDPWTKVQVDARAERSLTEVLDEWDEAGPKLEAALAGGNAPAQLVFDIATHEHDLRGALGASGAHDADSTHIGLEWLTESWAGSYGDRGFPPLRIVAGPHTIEAGPEEPEATVVIPAFDALRALSGRRSATQLAAYDWDADPTPWLAAFTWGPFTVTKTDLAD
ncbi:MAG: hypothetical protein JWM05_433 [Acidimicrobiales bacterium]|nr:hypothetical protein [Acidimicrobiales bacterium]